MCVGGGGGGVALNKLVRLGNHQQLGYMYRRYKLGRGEPGWEEKVGSHQQLAGIHTEILAGGGGLCERKEGKKGGGCFT